MQSHAKKQNWIKGEGEKEILSFGRNIHNANGCILFDYFRILFSPSFSQFSLYCFISSVYRNFFLCALIPSFWFNNIDAKFANVFFSPVLKSLARCNVVVFCWRLEGTKILFLVLDRLGVCNKSSAADSVTHWPNGSEHTHLFGLGQYDCQCCVFGNIPKQTIFILAILTFKTVFGEFGTWALSLAISSLVCLVVAWPPPTFRCHRCVFVCVCVCLWHLYVVRLYLMWTRILRWQKPGTVSHKCTRFSCIQLNTDPNYWQSFPFTVCFTTCCFCYCFCWFGYYLWAIPVKR